MMPDLRRNRECGECVQCCTGTLHATIHGYPIDRGRPCHFLGGNGCTIYEKRDTVCREFRCAWLKDDATNIPEWMRPDLSKVIITEANWGENNQHQCLIFHESGQKIDSTILNWIYMYCSSKNICADIQVDGIWYQMGPPEFVEHMKVAHGSRY